MMKKIISMISIFTIDLTIVCMTSNMVSAQTLTPVTFDKNTRYEVVKLYDKMPNTFEAVINIYLQNLFTNLGATRGRTQWISIT